MTRVGAPLYFNVESCGWQNQVNLRTVFCHPDHTGSFQNTPALLDIGLNILNNYNIYVFLDSSVHLSDSGQERAACSDAVQGYRVDSAVHQKLLPVGERSEEPASFPGEVP